MRTYTHTITCTAYIRRFYHRNYTSEIEKPPDYSRVYMRKAQYGSFRKEKEKREKLTF